MAKIQGVATISIGVVALAYGDLSEPKMFLHNADRALYRAAGGET